jgi:ERCC4-related helicase/ERCC4-type nuclease
MAKIVHPHLTDGIEARAYQLESLKTALGGSTLMVMPTGFGKTAVQWMMMAEHIRRGADKILLIAPTTGLVDQQWRMAKERLAVDESTLVKYTGDTSPAKREELWESATIVFATAQVIDNDVLSQKISLENVALLIVDEAHHAVGNHAFAKVGRHYRRQAKHPRVLAATASPGTKEEQIRSVAKELNIGFLNYTRKSDPLLAPYAVELDVNLLYLDLPEQLQHIINPVQAYYAKEVESLQRLGFLAPVQYVSSKHLEKAQLRVSRAIQHRDVRAYDAARKIADLRRLLMVLNLIQTQGMGSTKLFLDRAEEEQSDARKTSRFINTPIIRNLRASLVDYEEFHPKHGAMKNLVDSAFKTNPEGKVILFTEFRDTVDLLAEKFESHETVRPGRFIGQSSRGSSKGMSTKEQLAQLEKFRQGEINLLIATSVGEEGLDVPAADMVILYEPVPSAIRLIQRRGRTARQRDGSVHVLIAKETKDVYVQNASEHQEERMNAILTKMVSTNSLQNYPGPQSDATAFSIDMDEHSTLNLEEYIEQERHRLKPVQEEIEPELVHTNNHRVVHQVAEPIPPEFLRTKQQKGLFDFGKEPSKVDVVQTREPHPMRTTILFDATEDLLDTVGHATQSAVNEMSPPISNDVLIHLDYRESRSTLPAYLRSLGCKVELTYLPAGDIRLSERILIERKTSSDLGESIKDGRLIHQCRKLLAGSSRPMLLIETGEGDEHRLHPNAVLGALAYITVELRIPVVLTKNALETAHFLHIAKEHEDKFLQSFRDLVRSTPAKELHGPSISALMEIDAMEAEVPDWVDTRIQLISDKVLEFITENFDFDKEKVQQKIRENPTLGLVASFFMNEDS